MNTRFRHIQRRTLTALGISLLGNVILALAMFLFAADALAMRPASTSTQIVKSSLPQVTQTLPSSLTRLEPSPYVITLAIDHVGLLTGEPQATENVKNQVKKNDPTLMKRRAGLILAFGGAPTQNQIDLAKQVTNKVETILQNIGNPDQVVFTGTVFHVPLATIGDSLDTVTLEIYFYVIG